MFSLNDLESILCVVPSPIIAPAVRTYIVFARIMGMRCKCTYILYYYTHHMIGTAVILCTATEVVDPIELLLNLR